MPVMEKKDETPYRQAHLIEIVPENAALDVWKAKEPKTMRTCWLPSKGLRPFQRISLKGEDGWWWVRVIEPHETPRYLLHTDWNVGGIDSERK